MKLINYVFALIALAVVSVSAVAQSYTVQTFPIAATESVIHTKTSNYTHTVFVGRAEAAGLFLSFKLTGTGTGDIVLSLAKSVDGATFETTPSILLTNAATGATAVNAFHPLNPQGAGYLRLVSIKNADDAEAMTNIVVKVGVKDRL